MYNMQNMSNTRNMQNKLKQTYFVSKSSYLDLHCFFVGL